MDDPLAPAASLLGQLQRGRGAGFLTGLAAEPAVVAPLLLDCILQDPRWDRQLEQRAGYYAGLAAHVHLSLAPLEDHLRTPDAVTALPLMVLLCLARRGDGEAVAILVRYLAYGEDWLMDAFDAVVASGHASPSVGALGRMVLERFPRDEELLVELTGSVDASPTWERWAAAEPRVAPLIATVRARRPPTRPSEDSVRAGIDPAWDIAALLAHATAGTAHIYGAVAGQRAGLRDLPALLAAFFGDDRVKVRVATRALTLLGAPEALPPLLRVVEDFDTAADTPFAHRRIGEVRPIWPRHRARSPWREPGCTPPAGLGRRWRSPSSQSRPKRTTRHRSAHSCSENRLVGVRQPVPWVGGRPWSPERPDDGPGGAAQPVDRDDHSSRRPDQRRVHGQ